MAMTKVTRNYQITIPRDIRELAGIGIGDTIVLTQEEDEVKLRKATTDAIEKSFGSWKTVKDSVAFVRKLRKESEQRARRLGL